MAHKHSVYDTDDHFIIDPTSRRIISKSNKTKLMQYDHNSERFTFEMPRYVDGHDMSLCDTIYIDYTNLSSNKSYKSAGRDPVTDMQISPDSDDVIIFSWLISGNSTEYDGSLNFFITFECTTDTVIDYSWHTETFSSIQVGSVDRSDELGFVREYHDAFKRWFKVLLESAVEDGSHYVLTDADKQEIAELAADMVDVPDNEGAVMDVLLALGLAPVMLDGDGSVLTENDDTLLRI